jgi:hypothetical protein
MLDSSLAQAPIIATTASLTLVSVMGFFTGTSSGFKTAYSIYVEDYNF